LDLTPRLPVALYIHVPFCIARCPYCDFVVYAGAEARGPRARTRELFDALAVELGLRADSVDGGGPGASRRGAVERTQLQSVYFGGGTPSLMPPDRVAYLLAIARDRFGVADDAEITLEANPGPDELGDMAAFRAAGINRVSFGAQSLQRDELRTLGRRHSPEDVHAAVAAARSAGIGSVNLDLLYDIPGQTQASWERTLAEALALRPDHLSLYALTLDDPESEGLTGASGDHQATSPGARRWRDKARAAQDDDRAATQYETAAAALSGAGWHHYEISNWSLPGHESRHNLTYWRRRPYEAIGPGAHAFDGIVRRWNAAAMESYLGALGGADPHLPPGGAETLDFATTASERIILALRTDEGIPPAWASTPALQSTLEWGREAGLLEPFDDGGGVRLRLTLRGNLLSNELFSRLL
jgi:oxygen-independent coproporphyrinogen-3 oxidase